MTSVLYTDRDQEQTKEAIEGDVSAMAAITRSRDWVEVLARHFAAGAKKEQWEPAVRRVLERQGFAW